MAKTFELPGVRVCFDIDRSETLSEPHRCRHCFPGFGDRGRRDTLLSLEIRKGCSLYSCRHGSPLVRLVSAPSWSATSVRSRHSSVMCSLTWKRFWPASRTEPSPLVRSIREWPHMAVSKGSFPITPPSQEVGRIDSGDAVHKGTGISSSHAMIREGEPAVGCSEDGHSTRGSSAHGGRRSAWPMASVA